MVIENSARLCRIEMEDGDKQEHARIMREFDAGADPPI